MNPPKLTGDKWNGVLTDDWEIDDPTPADIDQALDRLDAVVYTLITVALSEDFYLMVGGGAGQYYVTATLDDRFWVLLRSQPASGTIMLNVGGQEGDIPAAQVVTKPQARTAILAFMQTGELDSEQEWEET